MGDTGPRPFPLIQTKPLPPGTEAYEGLRASILQELYDSIPTSLWLPEFIITNPPLNVTSISETCGLLTPLDVEITTEHDATSLAKAIASKKYTSVAVATAFCKRAAIAQQLTCCLTQFFMDEALSRAQYLDSYLSQHGKPIGPLHGVPISVKEHIALANHYSSYGFIDTRVFNEHDSQMIKVLREAGAVFYVKTNQPQGIMHLESDSHYGRVLNPYNINLSAGGSTGGEAALIAMKGSVLGIGTDIGGSIRGPAGFSGIHGFKPTSYLVTMNGFMPSAFPGELNILAATGPMGRSLRDMDLFMKVMMDSKMYLEDPRIIPLKWTGLETSLPERKLKVGIMWTDGAITPQPPVTRALKWAAEQLVKSNEFEVKNYMPYESAKAIKYIRQMYWPDSGMGFKAHMAASGEPEFPLTTHILKDALAEKEKTATEVGVMRFDRDQFRVDFVKNWNEQNVDIVLCPVFVGPASAHDTAIYWNFTALWNFVDYPGLIIPTEFKVDREKDQYPDDYKPLSEECKHVRQMWEETDFVGAPICLQVVGRRYHDNELMAAVGKLQNVLGFA